MLKLNASIRFHFTEKKKDINENTRFFFFVTFSRTRAFVVSFIVDYP